MSDLPTEPQTDTARASDDRAADIVTKWLVVLIVAPVIIITVGYIVSFPINLALRLGHFDTQQHEFVFILTRIIIVVAWVGGSVALIRMAWPRRKRSVGSRSPSAPVA